MQNWMYQVRELVSSCCDVYFGLVCFCVVGSIAVVLEVICFCVVGGIVVVL